MAFDRENVFTYPGGKRDSGVEDATIVATHMILAAADEGVDSCWINFLDPEKLAETLDLPENEEILMVMDLGYAAEGAGPLPNHSSRKPLEETVSYNCSTYTLTIERAERKCFSHSITTNALRALTLETIRTVSKYAIENEEEFIRKVREAADNRERECVCPVCGKTFVTVQYNARYCSDECRYQGQLERQRKQKEAKRAEERAMNSGVNEEDKTA